MSHDLAPRLSHDRYPHQHMTMFATLFLFPLGTCLPAGVGENDRLGDGQGLIEVTQGVQLPVLLLHVHVELLDTLQGKLVTLDENTDLRINRKMRKIFS